MDNEKILELLIRYDEGLCTQEELQLLETWYKSLHPEPAADPDDRKQSAILKGTAWLAIQQRTGIAPERPGQRLLRFGQRWVRAAIILVVAFAGGLAAMLFRSPFIPKYTRVVTPPGQILRVALADGSAAILQGGSRLRYPVAMTDSRTIYLDQGQAFFIVQPNNRLPFIVQTPSGMQTLVLGTSFSIQTFSELAIERVAVFTGKVAVKDERHDYGFICGGQAGEFEISRGISRRWISDSLEVKGWTKGQIVLNNVSFEEFAIALQHQYGYRIILQCPGLRGQRITISFTDKDSLAKVLQIIKVIYNVNTHINNTNKYVTIDKSDCDPAHTE